MYCYSALNFCGRGSSCDVTDGSVANTSPCKCGNAVHVCNYDSGLHCYASENYCFTGPPCAVTNGSIANTRTDSCRCGNEECTAATGLICYSSTHIGGSSCRKSDVGAFGYPRPNSGNCNDVTGRKSISNKAACEAAATSLGLTSVLSTVEVSVSGYPPGCLWAGTYLFYNPLTTSTTPCTYPFTCLCLSAPNCLETNGTTTNAAPCLCGNTGCTIASGLHCYASDNYCSTVPLCTVTDGSTANTDSCRCENVDCTIASGLHCYASENYCSGPPCTVTNGSIANTEPCRCGDEVCTIASGLICFSNTNGGGSCRKTDVGAFGYPRPTSGNCNDVTGRKSILDKAACGAAATSLGLSDVEANEVSYLAQPPGCYWGTNRLNYNTKTTSTASCSSNSNYCLCLLNQATCAQITDGISGGAFSCATGSIPKSNPETIKCSTTPCAANSDATENAQCCNQATCAQTTEGISGGPFSCGVGSSLKSNPKTINCGATPCDAAESIKCCSRCLQGQWQDQDNQLSCKKCVAGKISKEIGQSSNSCKDCVAGLYNPYEGHPESCLPCPTAGTGASDCAGCDPGKYTDSTADASDGDADCNVCSVGQFTDERDLDQCKDCPKGYYTNDQNSTDGIIRRNRCQECPRGTYGNQTKQETKEECKRCNAGRYSDIEGVAKQAVDVVCTECVAGKYSKEEGNVKDSNCRNCGSGTWSSTEAATSIDACKKCVIGKYSDDVGVADEALCKECDPGYEQTEEGKAYW